MGHLKSKSPNDGGARAGAALGRLRGGERATVYDVAQRAGVSAITVSRALNGGSCSAATREAVRTAARELGYEPNAAAQALASRRRRSSSRKPAGDASAVIPRVWQSYAEMMLRLVRPDAA